jgi:hypothetical protein
LKQGRRLDFYPLWRKDGAVNRNRPAPLVGFNLIGQDISHNNVKVSGFAGTWCISMNKWPYTSLSTSHLRAPSLGLLNLKSNCDLFLHFFPDETENPERQTSRAETSQEA